MEGVVEDCHLGSMGHERVDGTDATQMACIVYGSQVAEALDTVLYFLGYDAALLKEVATLHDAVTYGVDLVEALQRTILGVEQQAEYKLHAFLVVGHVVHYLFLAAVFEGHFHEGVVQSYALGATLCQHALVVHVVQLVLDGAAATVQY